MYIDLGFHHFNIILNIFLVNNHNIQKPVYEVDGDSSDSNSLPSLNSDKDSQVIINQREIFFEFFSIPSAISKTTIILQQP